MAEKKTGVRAARVSLERTVDSVLIHDIKNLAFRLSALLQNMDEISRMLSGLANSLKKLNTSGEEVEPVRD